MTSAIESEARRGSGRLWHELWVPVLAALVAFRVIVPLTALAAAPSKVPLFPPYDGIHYSGDAVGFYEAISNMYASFRIALVGPLGVGFIVLLAAALAAGSREWRGGKRGVALLIPAGVVSAAVTVVVHGMSPPGAAVVGWPLMWGLALFPLPALGMELTDARAFPVGLAIGLAANGLTVVATAYLGFRATRHRSVGLTAAALFASWPVWVGLVAGHGAWENSQWEVDTGLRLYTEPVSTALVISSLATLLGKAPGEGATAGSGLAIGFATVVKLSNGLIGLVLVPLVAIRYGIRQAAFLAAGGLVSLPIILAYWPKGYVHQFGGGIAPVTAYSLDYLRFNWRISTIFTVPMILVLVLPAVVGVAAIDGWYARSTLLAPIGVTVVAYSAYFFTYQHPRFLYVVLPPMFVLMAAGLRWTVCRRR